MEKLYQNMLQTIRNHPLLKKLIIYSSKYIPLITFIIYSTVLIYLFITKNNLLLSTIIKPLLSFIIVTIFRKIINRKRPYEKMNIKPLLSHKSVSAFSISLACLKINILLGNIMLILAILVSLSRILCGVHYISDVISAIIIAFFIAFI